MGMTTKTSTHCKRCGRHLTATLSIARGFGPTCWSKISAAFAQALTEHKQHQVAKAIELIEVAGIITLRRRTFQVVASNGIDRYLTAPESCTCPAGTRGIHTCYHRIAAQVLIAA